MLPSFNDKHAARDHVWACLEHEGHGRPPLPVSGRIPNFDGAVLAAERLFAHEPWRSAQHLKVNPDSPQAAVRELALARGIIVYVPTPRLTGGFWRLDPARIPAAALDTLRQWADPVALPALPRFDAIVTGCVAVTGAGKRCGKGAGYSDLEFALLRELGQRAVPVATTVHDCQLVADFPLAAYDQPLSLITTPTRTLIIETPLTPPAGIDWSLLDEAALTRMPLLRELRELRGAHHSRGES